MSRTVAFWDRLVSFLVALVLIFLCAWSVALYFHERHAQWLADNVNQRVWRESPQQDWFDWALIGIVIVGVIVGVTLILMNVSRRSISMVQSKDATTQQGAITFNISEIAGAVAEQLGEIPSVDKVNGQVTYDRGRATMQFTVNARATANVPAIRSNIEQAERDIRAAIANADVDTLYRIHLEPVER